MSTMRGTKNLLRNRDWHYFHPELAFRAQSPESVIIPYILSSSINTDMIQALSGTIVLYSSILPK